MIQRSTSRSSGTLLVLVGLALIGTGIYEFWPALKKNSWLTALGSNNSWIPLLAGFAVFVLSSLSGRSRIRSSPPSSRVVSPSASTPKIHRIADKGKAASQQKTALPRGVRKLVLVSEVAFVGLFIVVAAKIFLHSNQQTSGTPVQIQKKQVQRPAQVSSKRVANARATPPKSEPAVNRAMKGKQALNQTAAPLGPLPVGKQTVVQTVQAPKAESWHKPAKIPEKLKKFLDEIAREPSPCPRLLADIDRLISPKADLDKLFARLQRCKWKRNTYSEEQESIILFRHDWPDPWPEEKAIRNVIAAMTERVQPPDGVMVYQVPRGKAVTIDGVLDEEWNDSLVFAPKGSKGRIFVKTDGEFLYLGGAVPGNPSASSLDSMMVVFHQHLSPHFANEYFFIYGRGSAPSKGVRGNRIKPEDAPKISDWRERDKLPKKIRWKTFDTIYDDHVFPAPKAATYLQGETRMYEAAVKLEDIPIPRNRPFTLGINIDKTTDDGKNRQPVWPFEQDYSTGNPKWMVWLKIGN